ncbi:hypothetical protein JCM15765_19560 [Paradesulfitobacterium aromaticivorans]
MHIHTPGLLYADAAKGQKVYERVSSVIRNSHIEYNRLILTVPTKNFFEEICNSYLVYRHITTAKAMKEGFL